jgi:hypothetical protein
MSDDSRKPPRPSHPRSIPPEVPVELDSSWDDDALPHLELDDPMSESAFDRITAVPELPAEMFAQQVMAEQSNSAPPSERREPRPRLASEPPAVTVRPLDPMAMAQPPRSSPPSLSDMAVPPQTSVSPNRATARPGRNPGAEPTGVELMDMCAPAPATARSPSAELGCDPRHPVLELELELLDVARSGPPPPVPTPSAPANRRDAEISEMKDRYAMGDFTGALIVAEGMLELDADDIDARRYAQSCRDVLTQMYAARLGALTQRVRVAVPGDQIRWLSLDHRAGFVLSLIDGSSTVEELLDISGMNRLDALRILYTLFDQRVIALSET